MYVAATVLSRILYQTDLLFKLERYLSALRWCRAQDLFGSQIPVITGGFELRISCIESSYLTH